MPIEPFVTVLAVLSALQFHWIMCLTRRIESLEWERKRAAEPPPGVVRMPPEHEWPNL